MPEGAQMFLLLACGVCIERYVMIVTGFYKAYVAAVFVSFNRHYSSKPCKATDRAYLLFTSSITEQGMLKGFLLITIMLRKSPFNNSTNALVNDILGVFCL